MKTNEQKYQAIISWLYINDGKYPSKNKWREEFSKMLNETICDQSLTSLTEWVTSTCPNFTVPYNNSAVPMPSGDSICNCGFGGGDGNCTKHN